MMATTTHVCVLPYWLSRKKYSGCTDHWDDRNSWRVRRNVLRNVAFENLKMFHRLSLRWFKRCKDCQKGKKRRNEKRYVIEIRFSNVLTTGEASQLSEFIIPAISRSSWEVAQRSALTVHQRCFSNVAMVWLD